MGLDFGVCLPRGYADCFGAGWLDSRSRVSGAGQFSGSACWNFSGGPCGGWAVVVELKTADSISKAHEAQLLHHLRASPMEIGLVMNFGPEARVRRVVMQNERKGKMPVRVLQQL